MYPDPAPPVDRTGAGDSFASTLTWAPINSMSVVQYVGAQKGLLTREKLEKYLQDAPEDYKAEKLSL
jgi:sugar/nucleoside kinase (ribokinase family)